MSMQVVREILLAPDVQTHSNQTRRDVEFHLRKRAGQIPGASSRATSMARGIKPVAGFVGCALAAQRSFAGGELGGERATYSEIAAIVPMAIVLNGGRDDRRYLVHEAPPRMTKSARSTKPIASVRR